MELGIGSADPMAANRQTSEIEVLHGLHYDRYAGGIVAFLRHLDSAGRFPSALAMNEGAAPQPLDHQDVIPFPKLDGNASGVGAIFAAFGCARSVRRWLRAGPKRIYHGHSRAGLIVACWLRIFGERRVVATVHVLGRSKGMYVLAERLLRGRLYWLCPSVREYYAIEGEGWIQCLPDCLPDEMFDRSELHVPSDAPFVVACAGSLVAVKQWDLLIEALALLPPTSDVRVLHAGGEDGTEASARYAKGLRQLMEDGGMSSKITWLGELPNLKTLFEKSHCFVSVSRWEASSVAALEALAAGLPVIAADQSGTRDLVEASAVGELFASDSSRGLMQALMTAESKRGLRFNPAEKLARFRASHVAELHLAAYRAALS